MRWKAATMNYLYQWRKIYRSLFGAVYMDCDSMLSSHRGWFVQTFDGMLVLGMSFLNYNQLPVAKEDIQKKSISTNVCLYHFDRSLEWNKRKIPPYKPYQDSEINIKLPLLYNSSSPCFGPAGQFQTGSIYRETGFMLLFLKKEHLSMLLARNFDTVNAAGQ